MLIRPARMSDWAAIWPFFREITAAGETYPYPLDMSEGDARQMWMPGQPDLTVVATDDSQQVLGTAKIGPNKLGGGSHIATAGFMVDSRATGSGVGRALGRYALEWARGEGYRGMQFNSVVASNTRAVALWQALGFEILATVPEGFRRPSGEYVGLHIMYRAL